MTTTYPVSTRANLTSLFQQIEKIAVLTDFSPVARTALKYAARLARSYGADLVLAHAYLPPSFACAAPTSAMVLEGFDEKRELLKEMLLGEIREPWLEDIHCATALCLGGPAELVQELNDMDLIVVGTSGATGVQKALLGSTAEMVFRTSSKPVLTVGPHCAWTGEGKVARETVLCAVDLPSASTDVVAYALSIARQHDAQFLLLHVVEESGIVFAHEQASARAEVLQELRNLMPEDTAYGAETQYLVDFGNADTAILQEAHIHDAKLIVIGAHRTRVPALASRFAGGTAYIVAANAECPVLTIPSVNGSTLDVTDITESQQCRE
jgi:nucleotide-binding universal stress UspA family protein